MAGLQALFYVTEVQAPPPIVDSQAPPLIVDRENANQSSKSIGIVNELNISSIIEQVGVTKKTLVDELNKVIVGQLPVIDHLLISLLCQGHCLITGAPGLGKTSLVKHLARILDLSFKRVQFTPDLMPADIIGAEVLEEDSQSGRRHFRFAEGPLFANIVLADEINRTPPKTQAALLEAMAERQVTAAGGTHILPEPFFVLATQNPIELEGTYPLPEAQLDRFLLNTVITYLSEADEITMVTRTTAAEDVSLEPVLDAENILRLQQLVRTIPASDHVVTYAVRLVAASRPMQPQTPEWVNKQVKWGAGPRASQALILAGKANALLNQRYTVAIEDIQSLALPVLRHRIVPSFYAEAEGISCDDIIGKLLQDVPEPTE